MEGWPLVTFLRIVGFLTFVAGIAAIGAAALLRLDGGGWLIAAYGFATMLSGASLFTFALMADHLGAIRTALERK